MSRHIRGLKYLGLCILGGLLAYAIAFSFDGLMLGAGNSGVAQAQDAAPADPSGSKSPERPGAPEAEEASDGLKPFEELTAELEKQEGLFTTYRATDADADADAKIYLALKPEQFNQNFLLLATLESGLGEARLFRGWPINDLLIQFRETTDNRLQVVVPNTYIRNPGGQDWQQRLLDSSFSDSVIFAVPVVSIDPTSQAKLIDLSDLIVERDLVNLKASLGRAVSGYKRSDELSRINQLQVFDNNLELGTTAAFVSNGTGAPSVGEMLGRSLQGLADSRGFTLGIRYSLSALPENNGYQPRPADERVGYFLSVFRSPNQMGTTDPFVRYINRWHLEKQTPGAGLSAPKEPIVFWIENTVPPDYREDIKAGALLWNTAFEQAGFKDAIEVRQMPNNADWDPADVRYNVIRWSDSLNSTVAGVGPSRTNPLTGEILDADIVIDANVIRFLQQRYQTIGAGSSPEAETYLQMCGQRSQTWYLQWLAQQQSGNAGIEQIQQLSETFSSFAENSEEDCVNYVGQQEAAFGALALASVPGLSPSQLDKYIQQYLVMLTAHEVGHTLGLRHNFAGSGLLSPQQLNDTEITRTIGSVSSVMDYVPPNLAPPGVEQGDFFPTRLGAYDIWAIQYGYTSIPTSPRSLDSQQIIDQITPPGNHSALAYATDEDIFDFIDPEVNAWDLSSDPLQFSLWQMENAQAVWQRLNRLSVRRGEGYGDLRRRVDLVFKYFGSNTSTLVNYIGGQRFRRLNPWESPYQGSDRTPLEPISATKQRESLDALNQYVFAANAFEFSPQLLNQLPPDRWSHRGAGLTVAPLDYPIYERVLTLQTTALSRLMSAQRLARVRNAEFTTNSEDVLTISELFDSLYQGIWSEVVAPEAAVTPVSSLRRGLQRQYLNILSNLVLRPSFEDLSSAQSLLDFISLITTFNAPEDARVLARYQLNQIYDDVGRMLRRYGSQVDITTLAHWEEVRDRIDRVLDAPLSGA